MKILAGKGLPEKCADRLRKSGYEVIILPAFDPLGFPESTHADMLLYQLPGSSLLLHGEYYRENRSFFDSLGVNTVTDERKISPRYPENILFNAFEYKGILYGKRDCLSVKLTSYYNNTVNLKQGYAKCSCAIHKNCLITADRLISEAIPGSLLISPGEIDIDRYQTGFIGGASLSLPDGLAFFGDIEKHPDGEKILEYCRENRTEVISLSKERLFDCGGAVII